MYASAEEMFADLGNQGQQMPTFQATPWFERDWKQLTPELRARFQQVVTDQFIPDLARGA